MTFTILLFHCPFCHRLHRCTQRSFDENPWCSACLEERLRLAGKLPRDPLDDARLACGLPITGQSCP